MSISCRQKLSDYPQIAAVVFQLLAPAIGDGLSEAEATAIYNRIMAQYTELHGAAYFVLRDDLIRLLNMSDADFAALRRRN